MGGDEVNMSKTLKNQKTPATSARKSLNVEDFIYLDRKDLMFKIFTQQQMEDIIKCSTDGGDCKKCSCCSPYNGQMCFSLNQDTESVRAILTYLKALEVIKKNETRDQEEAVP